MEAQRAPLGGRPPHGLSIAFKEWASIVVALERRQQDLIFRKGGIAEEGRGFAVSHDRFFLFPTYFHHQRAGLREGCTSLYDDAMKARPPEGRLLVTSLASVKRTFVIEREADLALYESRHVYAPHVLAERLHGRHGTTLHALEVDVHVLDQPLDLPMLDHYGGCRSWVELEG